MAEEMEYSWIEKESTTNKNISLAQFDVVTSLVARSSPTFADILFYILIF